MTEIKTEAIIRFKNNDCACCDLIETEFGYCKKFKVVLYKNKFSCNDIYLRCKECIQCFGEGNDKL